MVGNNVQGKSSFTDTVPMYVHEEIVDGQKLSDIINMKHENTKYLPGCKLPENVVCLFCCLLQFLCYLHLGLNLICITWLSPVSTIQVDGPS